MANKTFTDLPAASSLTGSEVVPMMQSGSTKKSTAQAVADLASRAWSAITGKPTTLAGYGITDAATSTQGATADSAVQPGDLATVAFSGDYDDLINAPGPGSVSWGGIGGTLSDQSDLVAALGDKANIADLADVATSGAYSDLTGLPTLGTAAAAATSDFAAAVHTHAASDVISGTFADARISQGSVTQHQAAFSINWTQLIGTMPALAVTSVQTAASQAAMLALTTQEGDVVVRTDENKTYIKNSGTAGTMADFTQALFPTDAVSSVFGRTGAVVATSGDYTFAQIASTPTTLSGYGISDAAPSARAINTTAPLTGGGNLSADRTIAMPAATGSADGYATSAQITKLNGIAAGATANSSDATLLARANHTGTQASSTISDFNSSADARVVLKTEAIGIACSDETTALTAGTGKAEFRMPYPFTLTGVRAGLRTAQPSGSIFTVDINEGGVSVLSTKLTIENTEKTSTTAATPAVISDTALADDAIVTIDIDQIGASGAAGLKVWLIGHQ